MYISFNPSESAPKIPNKFFSGKAKGRIHLTRNFGTQPAKHDKYAIAAEKMKPTGAKPPKLNPFEKRYYVIFTDDMRGTSYKVSKASLKARLGISNKELDKALKEKSLSNLMGTKFNEKLDQDAANMAKAFISYDPSDFLRSVNDISLDKLTKTINQFVKNAPAEKLMSVKILLDQKPELLEDSTGLFLDRFTSALNERADTDQELKSLIEDHKAKEAAELTKKIKETENKFSSFKWEFPIRYIDNKNLKPIDISLGQSFIPFHLATNDNFQVLLNNILSLVNQRDLNNSQKEDIALAIGRLAVLAIDSRAPLMGVEYSEEDANRLNSWLRTALSEIAKKAKPEVTADIYASVLDRLSIHLQNSLNMKDNQPHMLHFIASIKEGLDDLVAYAKLNEKQMSKFDKQLKMRLDEKPVLQLLEAAYLLPNATKEETQAIINRTRRDVYPLIAQFSRFSSK